jgi:transcriptional regulator with XRE-family HTH domain
MRHGQSLERRCAEARTRWMPAALEPRTLAILLEGQAEPAPPPYPEDSVPGMILWLERYKALRRDQIARHCGVSKSTVSNWFYGRQKPKHLGYLRMLCEG